MTLYWETLPWVVQETSLRVFYGTKDVFSSLSDHHLY